MQKSMLEPNEYLVLSYGLGVYRITSTLELDVNSEALRGLGITDVVKTGEITYVALASIGHEPSKLELSIHDTEEFKYDERFVLTNASQKFKDRFYQLYKRNS